MPMTKNERFLCYETLSGKVPRNFKFYHNFRWVGLETPPEIWEIDNMKLVYLGFMSRSELEEFILNG